MIFSFQSKIKLALSLFLFSAISLFSQSQKLIPSQWLEFKTTEIYLGDFVNNTNDIDSVVINSKKISLPKEKDKISFNSNEQTKQIIELKIYENGKPISVLLKKSLKKNISYSFNPKSKTYKSVKLKGEFNGWTDSKTPLSLANGKWTTNLLLNPGDYQFKLVLDGKEQNDPNMPNVSNNMGGTNSLLKVSTSSKLKPSLSTKKHDSQSLFVSISNGYSELFVLYQNRRMGAKEISINGNILQIKIPAEAKSQEKSYIRVLAYNAAGLSNDLLIPIHNGQLITSTRQLDRNDPYAAILYNVFIDRFFNGNFQNDRPVADPNILPRANYLGGDIAGVEYKIKDGYFNKLGVNTLWLSPIVKNPEGAFGEWKEPYSKFSSYHGYWPISFTQIDDRLGTPAEFKSLIKSAHQDNSNVLLDFVAHHVHQEHPIYKQHPDWATSLYLPDGSLNTERWDEYRLTTWFDVFLPTLNLENSQVTQMLSDSALWWIKEYELDGFRHDATKHVPIVFWRNLTKKINSEIVLKEKRPIYQVGETYGSVELIGSYVSGGLLDGQFDFNVYDAALGAFAKGESFVNLKYRLNESLENYGSHNLMCYITGNQDRGRFISYAGGSLKFDEDAKKAGWTREIEVGDPVAYNRLAMLMAFNMTIPGLPVIYYGDEFGMPGGNDPDSRRMMRFDGQLNPSETKMYEITRSLTSLRNNNISLIYGDFKFLKSDENLLVYTRQYFNETAIVLINNAEYPIEYTISPSSDYSLEKLVPSFGSAFDLSTQGITLTLLPNTFEIFITK